MKFIKITCMLAFLYQIPTLMAQSPVLMAGNVEKATIGEQNITIKTTNAYGEISVYSPSIIRVRLDKNPIKGNSSYAVVGQPQKTKTTISSDDINITLVTDSVKAVIHKKPFS